MPLVTQKTVRSFLFSPPTVGSAFLPPAAPSLRHSRCCLTPPRSRLARSSASPCAARRPPPLPPISPLTPPPPSAFRLRFWASGVGRTLHRGLLHPPPPALPPCSIGTDPVDLAVVLAPDLAILPCYSARGLKSGGSKQARGDMAGDARPPRPSALDSHQPSSPPSCRHGRQIGYGARFVPPCSIRAAVLGCLAWLHSIVEQLYTGVLEWSHAKHALSYTGLFPMACKCCLSSTCPGLDGKTKWAEKLQLNVHYPDSDINELATGSLLLIQEENGLTAQRKYGNEIPIGPEYQADVPQWTGELPANYDDPETVKWLGTKVWPQANVNRKALFFSDWIGKERRLQLKREVGSAFFAWGFDRMGEEIALSWTDEEEAKFKAVAQLNAPSLGLNFWNRLHLSFQRKGMKELVSYYFNCFLLRRRCYQNRITPENIDSDDDDEMEFRFLGNRLGHCGAKYYNTKHTVCFQNTHCMDLD
ncbi:hypothetical protein PR202_ga30324 [Eleusine coracana subsp. coracana]|uniref:ELM2 domain-containing protein n=1 Tax=Eleusine coracana subsp. coracana TaxID=191504 RepID=A0AAV5DNZ3_ELECO|nr:hypothetical protein PR202_ga30324 [Eleusine coracana subsp. coracana]